VLVGEECARRGVHPLIAIKPDDYAPGVYDFAVLSGLQVEVFDQGGEAGFYESPDHGPARPWYWRFYALLGELAEAADVEVNSPAVRGCARGRRTSSPGKEGRRGQAWPFWWSDEIEEKNAKRRDTWCRAVFGSAAARGQSPSVRLRRSAASSARPMRRIATGRRTLGRAADHPVG
jgi:hypothetical protein